MLSPSSCHSCVWMQASPLNLTNFAASTVQLALSLSRHTTHLSLWDSIRIQQQGSLSMLHWCTMKRGPQPKREGGQVLLLQTTTLP